MAGGDPAAESAVAAEEPVVRDAGGDVVGVPGGKKRAKRKSGGARQNDARGLAKVIERMYLADAVVAGAGPSNGAGSGRNLAETTDDEEEEE